MRPSLHKICASCRLKAGFSLSQLGIRSMQWSVRVLTDVISLFLAALLVFAPMGAGQEVFTLAIAEADNSGAASTRTDAHRLVHLLRYGAAFFGIPTTFLLDGASEPSLAIGDFNHDGLPDLAVAEVE